MDSFFKFYTEMKKNTSVYIGWLNWNKSSSVSLLFNHCSTMLTLFKWRNTQCMGLECQTRVSWNDFKSLNSYSEKGLCLLSPSCSREKYEVKQNKIGLVNWYVCMSVGWGKRFKKRIAHFSRCFVVIMNFLQYF